MIVFNLRVFEACALDGFLPTLSIPFDEEDEDMEDHDGDVICMYSNGMCSHKFVKLERLHLYFGAGSTQSPKRI